MERKPLVTVVVAALVLLAGCASGVNPTATDGPADDGTGDGTAAMTGSIDFYISDEPNAISDFEHLNVTISKVGLHRVADGSESKATETAVTESATPDENETDTPERTAEPEDETETPDPTESGETEELDDGEADGDDEKEEDDEEEAETEDDDKEEGDDEEVETEDDEEDDEEEADDGEEESAGNGEWVEYESNATVDLTELVGENATSIGVLDAPAGEYDKVFVYVSEIDATLKNGEQVNVKLPSNKLHINEGFTVGDGSEVDFVFDIAVHEAGNSGKYILKPVVSQSGTDVDIEDVGEKARAGDEAGKPDDAGRSDDAGEHDGDDESETDKTETAVAGEHEETETGEAETGEEAGGPDDERSDGEENGNGQGNDDASLVAPTG